MPQIKELSLGTGRPPADELLGPEKDSFPTSRSSKLAPGEFSPITKLGTDRLIPFTNSFEPQISDNGHSPK